MCADQDLRAHVGPRRLDCLPECEDSALKVATLKFLALSRAFLSFAMEQQPNDTPPRPAEPSTATVQRALRLLANQQRAARAYYLRNREAIKARTAQYWKDHRDELNERRRQRYEEQRNLLLAPGTQQTTVPPQQTPTP